MSSSSPSTPSSPSPSPPPPQSQQQQQQQQQQQTTVLHRRFQYCPEDGHRFTSAEKTCPVCGLDPAEHLKIPTAANAHVNHPAAVVNRTKSAGSGDGTEDSGGMATRWRKLLYVKQPFPDNFVDHTFLDALERNVNLIPYEYWTLVVESGNISQHLSSVAIFISLFMYFSEGYISAHFLLGLGLGLTLAGYICWHWTAVNQSNSATAIQALKGAILLMSMLMLLSPILRTLTEDYSGDTIWALTIIFFLANVLLHDYSSSESVGLKHGTLSLNAAIFGSVLLASRFSSNIQVFALMAFATEWFALFPMLRKHLKRQSRRLHVFLTAFMFVLTSAMLFSLTIAMAVIYTIGMLFVTFFCPFWLMWLQRYKNEIHGPWDEARLSLRPGEQSGDTN